MLMEPSAAKKLGLKHNVLFKHLSDQELERKRLNLPDGDSVSLEFVSKEFRTQINGLDDQLISFLRASLWGEYKIKAGIKDVNKFSITMPTDIRFEKHTIKHYISVYSTILNHFNRSDVQDEELIKNPDTDFRIRAIALAELESKKIAIEQIRLGRIILEILKDLKSPSDADFKLKYMKRIPEFDKEMEGKIKSRLKISNYLKSFYLSKWLNH